MFIIVYARIIDKKKNGLEMEGPFLGPESDTLDKAHAACEEIVTSSKVHTIIRIYDLDEISEQGAKEKAEESFKQTFKNMNLASKIIERPIIKRKRKKVRPKADRVIFVPRNG